jgi:2-keto-4-pentenoate hydratase
VTAQPRDEAVSALLGAYRDGKPVQPLTDSFPGLGLDEAYAIQLAQVHRWQSDGAVVKGHKIGLSSLAMQRQFGVDEPDFGHLTDAMFHPESHPIDPGGFLQPRIEPEIAVVLDRPLRGPGITLAEAMAAVDFLVPALEIVDSRISDWRITLPDTVADNASSGGVVLGSAVASLSDVDIRLIGTLLQVGGEVVQSGASGAVLGSPLNSVVWLANTLGRRGVTLEAGHVVLTGSITAAVSVGPGDAVTASFAGMGTVTARFGQ